MQLIRDSAKALSMRDCAYTFLAESQFLLNFIVFDAAVFKSIASPLQLIVKGLLRRLGHIHTIIPFISSLTPPQSSATVWGGVSHNIASSPRAPPFYGNVCVIRFRWRGWPARLLPIISVWPHHAHHNINCSLHSHMHTVNAHTIYNLTLTKQ